ncbi:hypothetical protein Pelo_292 [Pelomyxa schiedti]|nr:hypothetical protein Pelo_292 [Pelomyxa schiedti]
MAQIYEPCLFNEEVFAPEPCDDWSSTLPLAPNVFDLEIPPPSPILPPQIPTQPIVNRCSSPFSLSLYQQHSLEFVRAPLMQTQNYHAPAPFYNPPSPTTPPPALPLPLSSLPLPLNPLSPSGLALPLCDPSSNAPVDQFYFEPPSQSSTYSTGSLSPTSSSSSCVSSPLHAASGSSSDDSVTPPPSNPSVTVTVPQPPPPTPVELPLFLESAVTCTDSAVALQPADQEAPKQEGRKRRRCASHKKGDRSVVSTPTTITPPPPSAPPTPVSTPIAPPVGGVKLPRSTLLKMSSCDIQEYARSVTSARVLTTDEVRDLKKQKRLVRNRESAQLSRQRKREQIEHLEEIVRNLTHDNDTLKKVASDLRTQMATIQAENAHLKKQILDMESRNTPHVHAPTTTPHPPLPISSKRIKVTGLAFMLVLFVFGMGVSMYWPRFEVPRLELPVESGTSLQPIMNSFAHSNTPRVSRVLMEAVMEGDTTPIIEELTNDFDAQILPVISAPPLLSAETEKTADNLLVLSNPEPQIPPMGDAQEDAAPLKLPEISPSPLPSDPNWAPKNMTYLVAENILRLDPAWSTPNVLFGDDPSFALLVPYSSLNRMNDSTSLGSNDLVEVMCTVVGVSVLPQHCLPSQASV